MRNFGLALCLWALGATAGSAAVLRIEVVGEPVVAEMIGLQRLPPAGEPNDGFSPREDIPLVEIQEFPPVREAALEAAFLFLRSTTGYLNIEVGEGVPSILECGGLLASICAPRFGFEPVGRLQVDFVSGIFDLLVSDPGSGGHSLTNTSYSTVYEFCVSCLFIVGDERYLGPFPGVRLQADITSLSLSFVDPTPVPLPASAGLMLAGLAGLALVRRRRGKGESH